MGAPDIGQTCEPIRSGVTLFERYRLERSLDEGTRGRPVWLAHDIELDRDVVLKFLSVSGLVEGRLLADLKRETRRNLDLAHPHIARTFDFLSDGARAAMAMEYVDGRSLAELRSSQPQEILKPEKLEKWLAQFCDALEYAHTKAGVIHRELDPRKILINRAGDAKLIGFGTAQSWTETAGQTMTAQIDRGADHFYVSPEYAQGEEAAFTDDVFSLGVILYELITGRRPFPDGYFEFGDNENIRLRRMTDKRRERQILGLKPVPEQWEELVAKCLARRAEDRFSSAAEIVAALAAPVDRPAKEKPAAPGTRSEPPWKPSPPAEFRPVRPAKMRRIPFLMEKGARRRSLPPGLISGVLVFLALVALGGAAAYYIFQVRAPEKAAAALAEEAFAAIAGGDFKEARSFAQRIESEYPESRAAASIDELRATISGAETRAMKTQLRDTMTSIRDLIAGGRAGEAEELMGVLDRLVRWDDAGEIAVMRTDFKIAKAESDASQLVTRIRAQLVNIENAVRSRGTLPSDPEMTELKSGLLSLQSTFGSTAASSEGSLLAARFEKAEGEKRAWAIVEEVENQIARGEKREATISLARLDAYGDSAALGEKARLRAAIEALAAAP